MLHTFLDFELDEARSELRRQGATIATQRRVFDLIVYLLRSRDRVVSRDELMDALWQGNVVSDAAISQVIMLARKALNDEGESQRVIRTVRGRGIRFVAEVQSGDDKIEPARVSPVPALVEYAPPAPLLGRSQELRVLLERLSRAELGKGSLVLIEGEPGAGKSTLAEQLASQARERGFEVIWGRAWEGGGAPPFWPWIQVLRAIAEREGSEQVRAWLDSAGSELLPLLPEFGVSAQQPRDAAPNQGLEGVRARFRQFDVLSRMLRHLCARSADGAEAKRPWLILLDDLHAADDASLQLVRFLMPDLGDLGLLLVGTYRGLESTGKHALATLSESAHDSIVRLRGLTPTDVAELLKRKLGHAVDERLAAALHNVSAGNPLLLSELCSRLSGDPEAPLPELSHLADFALPERIASAVRKHLEELPEETRAALSAASALGREFSPPLLAQLLACSELELSDFLAPALRRGVLRASSAPGRLLFSHVLVCNAVYAELPARQRVALHGRIGALLEQNHTPLQLPLHELAHHYYLAASDGYRDKALSYAQRAAEQAASVMAHESAANLYDRAIALADLQHSQGAHLHALLCAAGMAWYRSGDMERASARYDRAIALARAEQDVELFAEAAAQYSCTQRGMMLHEPQRAAQQREALALLPPGDSRLRALLLSGSTVGLRSPDSLAERRAATMAAIEMARRLGDPEVLLWTLDASHFALWGSTPPDQLLPIAQEMAELSRRTGHGEMLLDALLWTAADSAELGDFAAVLHIQQEYNEALALHPSPWHRYMGLGSSLLQAGFFGDLVRARELSEQMLAFGQRLQERLADGFFAVRTMFLDFREQRPRKLADGPFAPAEVPRSVPADYRAFWALTWADCGHREAARSVLLETLAGQRDLLDPLRRPTLAVMAEVAVILDERAAAQTLYELLRADAGRHMLLQACVYVGPVNHYLGILAGALGQHERARAHFEEALRMTIPAPFAAETQCEYGRLLATRRATCEQAIVQLEKARDSAQRFGLRRCSERASEALGQVRSMRGEAPA